MLLTSEQDLIVVLGIVAAVLLTLCIGAGVLATVKSMQVRQFQDLLFKAERKIDTLERRMFNVLNAVPVALVETDATGKFTFANRAAHQLLGRKDNELIGLRFHSATWGITFPDGRVVPADMLPIARTLRGQTVKGFQHLIVNHGSHEKILVSVTSMPIMNGNGEVIGSTSAMVELETHAGEGVGDLTGLWRGHWFTAAGLPFWGLDAKGQIVDINNAALDAFEVTREEVLGRNWTQVFVSDADFQRAIDYLGDAQDETSPRNDPAIRMTLRGKDGEKPIPGAWAVSGWAVHTHEGGEQGITVMAIPADAVAAPALPETASEETDMAFKPASELTDDDAQELEDLRNAEVALAALGIGVWQYDREADTIIEDEGMRRLIGREYAGGPTLISDDDQTRADAAFGELLGGRSNAINLDIRVVDGDSERWITLRGQAKTHEDGERHIFGVAFDSTSLKQTPAAADVVIETAPGPSEADIEKARQDALEEARKDYEAKLEAAREAAAAAAVAPDPALGEENENLKSRLENLQAELADAALAQGRLQQEIEALKIRPEPETLEPVIVREPDPAVVEENESLKSRLENLQAELADAATHQSRLQQEIDALNARPEPEAPEPVIVREPDPAVVEENESLKARLESLRAELTDAATYHGNLQRQIAELIARPEPVADTSRLDARITALEAQLQEADAARNELQVQLSDILLAPKLVELKDERDTVIERLNEELEQAKAQGEALSARLDAIASAPPPEPDTREWEEKVASAEFETRKWQAAYDDAQARLAAVPPPPAVDIDALTARLDDLQASLTQSLAQQAELQARVEQLNTALGTARRYETVGRLTGDVAQDFAQMLGVINGALDIMSRQADNEQIKRLSEAALAAGKRGERLTRQLQAFQTEDY